jgi:hypothetical protein
VDLVVQGHDHNYSRSHQITQLAKVVDSDNAYAKGRGTVFAVVGNGGHKPREITRLPGHVGGVLGDQFCPAVRNHRDG